jgi:O-antigen/teichoic acid export membrane protein
VSNDNLKLQTARTLKWNVIDRVMQQVLYAVTGIVLARELSQSDFGLVGAVMIFQAFASLLVDSGFSYALIQRKQPTRLDYSSVLWFNLIVATAIYVILWFAAPLIAMCFENDSRLIPLSRVMFVSFILNASAIVQTNRFVKAMNVRPVAISNSIGLFLGAVVGIWLAVSGWGAWAIVWQTIVNAGVKSLILWSMSKWVPMLRISWASLRSFMSVGLGMMFTSFLNTLFLNIYSFFIGNRVGLTSLGYYTQSDKWSKMGISSLSQVFTSTFLPVLSGVQDNAERFANMVRKINRFTAYLLFPAMLGLTIIATPLFHVLFGTKWDPSILLFQLLLIRGIFTVLTSLYSNYLLALGRSKLIVWMEVLRDGTALVALAITFPYMAATTTTNPVYGLSILLWGQLLASIVAWIGTIICVSKQTHVSIVGFIADCLPYLFISLLMIGVVAVQQQFIANDWLSLICGVVLGAAIYLGTNLVLRSRIQADVIAYFRGKLQ